MTFTSEKKQLKKITKLNVFNEKAVIHKSSDYLDHQLHADVELQENLLMNKSL